MKLQYALKTIELRKPIIKHKIDVQRDSSKNGTITYSHGNLISIPILSGVCVQ